MAKRKHKRRRRTILRDGPNPVDVHVGKRVRERRVSLGMSQAKLGEYLGLTFQQIQKYEKGTNRISASKLWALSHFFKVSVEWFFEGLGEAGSAGMPCILGSMLEMDLGISAALQLAASVNCKLYASALSHYQMYDASLLEQPLRQKGATLYIPTGPGLGVTVSEAAINQYRESP